MELDDCQKKMVLISGGATESSSEAMDKAMLLKLKKVTIRKVRRERERESSTDCQ